MFVAALAGPRLAARRSPKAVARLGLVALAIGSGLELQAIDVELDSVLFGLALAVFGAGAGLLASQLGNIIMSSVEPARTNEAGGLQGTAQNLGASLGTALIGAILLAGLTSAFVDRVSANPALPADVRTELATLASSSGLDVIPVAQVEEALAAAGLPPDQVAAVSADYSAAQLDGLRNALGAVAVFALLALWFTRHLPDRLDAPAKAAEPGLAMATAA
jgi:hypothetical protein